MRCSRGKRLGNWRNWRMMGMMAMMGMMRGSLELELPPIRLALMAYVINVANDVADKHTHATPTQRQTLATNGTQLSSERRVLRMAMAFCRLLLYPGSWVHSAGPGN